MTDEQLLLKKLAVLETCVEQLRTLARPEALETDIRERRFVEHTLQVAIQAALDVASHIVADARLGEPATNRQLFELLVGGGWIALEQVGPLRAMAGFRNILVHGYADVDLDVVRSVLRDHLDDLLDFAQAVRGRVSAPDPDPSH